MQETKIGHLIFCAYINYNDKSCDVPVFAQMMPIPLASLSHMGDALYI
jgi:hypothetical protein